MSKKRSFANLADKCRVLLERFAIARWHDLSSPKPSMHVNAIMMNMALYQ